MCLIIAQRPGTDRLPMDYFDNAWSSNHDGAGLMFIENGQLMLQKGIFKLKELKTAYKEVYARVGQTSHICIHFRYSTHGLKNKDNCHPHNICGGEALLMHNGILSDFDPPYGSKESDTAYFCRTVLAFRNAKQMVNPIFVAWLETLIGKANKFVILNKFGELAIANEDIGHWKDGCWFSNYGYLGTERYCGYSSESWVTRGTTFHSSSWRDEDDYPSEFPDESDESQITMPDDLAEMSDEDLLSMSDEQIDAVCQMALKPKLPC